MMPGMLPGSWPGRTSAAAEKECMGSILGLLHTGKPEPFEEAIEIVFVRRRNLEPGQDSTDGRTVIPVVEEADVPAFADAVEESNQRAGALRKLEPDQSFVLEVCPPSDHEPNMEFRHLVSRHIHDLEAVATERFDECLALLDSPGEPDADEDVRGIGSTVAIVELRHRMLAKGPTQNPEGADRKSVV